MIERQFGKQVKIVRSDNRMEFSRLKPYFDENGSGFQTSCVGTLQQNGRVEKKHRHILNVARALLFQSCFPINFWGEFVLTTGSLINKTPTELLDGKTPYEVFFGKPPQYKQLSVFGCLC